MEATLTPDAATFTVGSGKDTETGDDLRQWLTPSEEKEALVLLGRMQEAADDTLRMLREMRADGEAFGREMKIREEKRAELFRQFETNR